MPRVFVSDFIPGDILEPLATLADVDVWSQPSGGLGVAPRISSGGLGVAPQISSRVPRETLLERLADCDGWLSMLSDTIDVELLDSAPKLRVISQMSVGVDNIDVEACRGHWVTVGHTPDVLTETTADTAFALIGAAVRRLPEGEAIVKSGAWGPWDPWHFLSSDLHGASLGIVGMGRIGQAISRRARGFDMRVLYTARTTKDVPGATRLELAELLEISDIVVIAVPLSDETRGMIGLAELGLMKDSAVLVNIARGPIVDTDALVAALADGMIGGAALDVTDPEPLPPDHPLLQFPNCLVVPHIGSATIPARRAMAALAVANLVAYLRQEPMPAWLPGSAAQPQGDYSARGSPSESSDS